VNDLISQIRQKIAERGKRLNPPLGEPEVARFEVEHGIELPEGYRRFLTEVGNGGHGPPYCGLAPLGRSPYWETSADIAKPFPFTKPWVWEEENMSDEGFCEQVFHGGTYLGTDGCGQEWHLIVTGPERGNIWLICGEGIAPTRPRRDFLTWYTDWLDGVENWWM
jgi:hypothetical protein